MNITNNKILDGGLEIIASITNGQRDQAIAQFKKYKKARRICLLRTLAKDAYKGEGILATNHLAHSALQILLPHIY